jgi:hypothetical protein
MTLYKWNRALLVVITLLMTVSCRQDMHDQPKYEPLERSQFFGDDRASRPLVEGTVARGHLKENDRYFTGKTPEGEFVSDFPVPVTRELVERGHDRYNIFCTPCHDIDGNGGGMVVRRGFKRPPSFHIDRLRAAQPGYIYDVITNGFATMLSYSEQVPVQDRWAIAAYVKALQLSQHISINDLPEIDRQELETGKQQ